MNLQCLRCGEEFDSPITLGYCPGCLEEFKSNRERIGQRQRQRPAPGVFMDGKFSDERMCPRTICDPISGWVVCGLCGSSDIEPGYGLGSGFGMGSYEFCCDCHAFLDFCEDRE